MKTPFPIDPVLTGITLTYRNQALIADLVLPRLTPIGKQEFKWTKWALADAFTIPDTRVGRKGKPNEVEFSGTQQTGSTLDYGLDDLIPYDDEQNAMGTVDPRNHATEVLTDLILLDREVRTANLIFANATYPATNRVTLAGNDQWSAYTQALSDPIEDIQLALDTPIVRPNIAVFGRATFTKLVSHPKIVKAVQGNDGDSGIARRRQIAELFELSEVHVGESYFNSAKPGQAATIARTWGKHAAFLYKNPIAKVTDDVTFGFTVQYKERVSGSIPEPTVGLRGADRVRVGESVAEIVAASDLGYFIENAVA